MTVKGYNHMALRVSDLEQAERFYCGALGLRKLPRPDFAVGGAWLAVGDAQLHLVVFDGPRQEGRLPHMALSVDLDDLRRIVEVLPASGGTELAPLVSRDDDGTEVWSAMYADPDGNVVELTTAPTS